MKIVLPYVQSYEIIKVDGDSFSLLCKSWNHLSSGILVVGFYLKRTPTSYLTYYILVPRPFRCSGFIDKGHKIVSQAKLWKLQQNSKTFKVRH